MATERPRAVLVPVSASFGETVAGLLTEAGFAVETAESPPAPADPAPAVIVWLAGGDEAAGLDRLAAAGPSTVPQLVIGAAADHRLAVAAVRRGAADYLALPDDVDLLRRTLERLATAARAAANARVFVDAERTDRGFGAILGRSPALTRILDQARRVAEHADVTVLLGGETGTGKELLARAIHYHSPRRDAPFLEINCTAIPANLLESELFGHERGAFTGAVQHKPGLLELADKGTVLLDEVGHLPLELQPKLLRALESRTIRRVGGQQSRAVDLRVIAATHVDLARAVREGRFREDLFFRLNVVPLVLPPLRERGNDVLLLAEAFASTLAASYRLPVPAMTPTVRAALGGYPWPGNIRELRNAIERALILSPPGTLDLSALGAQRSVATPDKALPFPDTVDNIVRAAALAMLRLCDDNRSEAARRLGVSRPRLQRILEGSPIREPDTNGDDA